jgi:hypothetical protein
LATVLVSQDRDQGAAVSSLPRFWPSTLNCTPTTPTLSEAFAFTLIVFDTVAPFAGALIDTVGAVPSPGAGVQVDPLPPVVSFTHLAIEGTPWSLTRKSM